MRTPIKAIIFDWDGVLLDSMPIIALGIQKTAKSFGVDITVEQILATYFQPKEAFYKSIGIDPADVEELRARHRASDEIQDKKNVTSARLFPDVLPALEKLHAKKLRMGIATMRSDSYIEMAIEKHRLHDFFFTENIVGGQEVKENKIKALVERFALTPSEALFVGDLPSDITSGKKAGVQSAGICRTEAGKPRLQAENPDYMLNSLEDLLKIV